MLSPCCVNRSCKAFFSHEAFVPDMNSMLSMEVGCSDKYSAGLRRLAYENKFAFRFAYAYMCMCIYIYGCE